MGVMGPFQRISQMEQTFEKMWRGQLEKNKAIFAENIRLQTELATAQKLIAALQKRRRLKLKPLDKLIAAVQKGDAPPAVDILNKK